MILLRFSRGSGIAGAIVRAATWSPFAHVGFLAPEGHVIDATPALGVARRVVRRNPGDVHCQVDFPGDVVRDALSFALSQQGKPYDWKAIVGFAMHRDWHDDHAWFCSELVVAAFEAVGWPLLRTNHLDRVTPRDLFMSPYLIPLSQAGGGRSVAAPQTARSNLA